VSLFDVPLEQASIAANVAIRITTLLADIAQQYSQTRPWMLLDESAAYGSSAMPQKRNPGIINKTRAKAGDVIGAMQTSFMRAHNLPLGMYDNKESVSEDNTAVFVKAVHMLELARWAFEMLKINKERALEELENDWTCTMALAETLQMRFGVPFRVGHNFASGIVTVARREGYYPKNFPFAKAQEIFRETVKKLEGKDEELPLDEAGFRETLSPEYVVRTRVGTGSPAPETVAKGLAASAEKLTADLKWLEEKVAQLQKADSMLNSEFEKFLK
jgi:argininosuccinate lyase